MKSSSLVKWGLPSKTFQGSQLNLCLAPFLSDFYLTWIFIPGSVFRDTWFKIQILSTCYPPFFLFHPIASSLPRLLLNSLESVSSLHTFFFHPLSLGICAIPPWSHTKKNLSLYPTIFSTNFLFFILFLHCPSFCHCSLNILALFSNYLLLINSLYLASALINFLKFITIKNVIPLTNYMSCFLLLCLSISFLQIHLKFYLKLSSLDFYDSDFSEYLKWLLSLHFFCLIANFVFAPHNHFIPYL